MNIGDVARMSGLSAKTIRYYEDIGLVTPLRGDNGYRSFVGKDIDKLVFLGRARALGFSIKDCRTLLELYEDDGRASANVKSIAQGHLDQVEKKIKQLQMMQSTLERLVENCAGDEGSECPILDELGHEMSNE